MLAIAQTLGYESVKAFRSVLDAHRHNVSRPFGRMVTDGNPQARKLDIAQIRSSLDDVLGDNSVVVLDEFMSSRLVTGA